MCKKNRQKKQSNLNFHFHTLQPDAQTIKKTDTVESRTADYAAAQPTAASVT